MMMMLTGTVLKQILYLKVESLVEDRVKGFLVDLGVILLLLVWENENSDVRVGGAATVHGEKICSLQDAHCQLHCKRVSIFKIHTYSRCKENTLLHCI